MLKKIIGKIWRKTPSLIRNAVVRVTQSKFTISVGAIVINPEGKVLLLDHVLRPASGWGIPGGFINQGEQPAEALKRELCEEIGLEITAIEMIQARTTDRHLEILFVAEAHHGKGEVQSLEIKEVCWFELDEMPAEMGKSQKELIGKVLANRKAAD